MKTAAKICIWTVVILIIGAAIWAYMPHTRTDPAAALGGGTAHVINYSCNEGKTISASFAQGQTKPPASPGQPPIPGGTAHIVLSDGRQLDLMQTISADGVRYANSDESFVFWTKGNGALVLENNEDQTFIGCVRLADDPGSLPEAYSDGMNGFSIRYPAGYTADTHYAYQALGPGKVILGVKFSVPSSMASDTNLSADSYIAVEQIPQAGECSAALFVPNGTRKYTITDRGVTYSYATTSQAAAGNRYDESVYAFPNTNPCLAIRYFIHYSAFENYPAGSIKRFDEQSLVSQFDSIRRTLVTL